MNYSKLENTHPLRYLYFVGQLTALHEGCTTVSAIENGNMVTDTGTFSVPVDVEDATTDNPNDALNALRAGVERGA